MKTLNKLVDFSQAEEQKLSMAALPELGSAPGQPLPIDRRGPHTVIEFRHPLSLTREGLDAMPDRDTRMQELRTIRRRAQYNPEYAQVLGRVFPEGETQYPLSPLEERFFDTGTEVMMDPKSPLAPHQIDALGLANGIDAEEAASQFREEARLRESMDALTVRYDIGTYHMGRQVIRELDRQIAAETAIGQDLEALVRRMGTEAYLPKHERALLKRYRQEVELKREYERTHPHVPSLSRGDRAVLGLD